MQRRFSGNCHGRMLGGKRREYSAYEPRPCPCGRAAGITGTVEITVPVNAVLPKKGIGICEVLFLLAKYLRNGEAAAELILFLFTFRKSYDMKEIKTKQGAYSAPCTPEPGDFISWTAIAEAA